ncbi:catalase family peroxidase [Domibacillus sp. DTU_2020_1001157_1_SI_ALB_TIR_016]|uniref:catalase family peroxidase n=1 Tax=Domibacillus sp. DTU_2020_1001157_1_SI_ALB_TIR_016 TaxID=3077789 RepID=UPI0028E2EC8B|nr:catalase family peroxidase [Domibacillus sp. DTU_2020_1001157_1_SI_ALB_TIR_016]WNS80540.1 catalase family peroxidase [Domibacillus sp. DTU_2020_1001157_1_SI_ALB_TIR_016]
MNEKYTGLAETAIQSIEKIAGTHPGFRRAHAKGCFYQAVFVPNGEAAPYTKAVHLQQRPVPAVVRFSDSSPNPNMIDSLSPVKGMSVQFHLPNGEETYLVSVNVPVFLTKTPEAFVEMMRLAAEGPGPRDLMKLFIDYPESKAAFQILKQMKPFVSYSTSRYFPIHTFYFVNEAGDRQPVKYEWIPEKAFSAEAKKEAVTHPADYLEKELEDELPVSFTLSIILGKPGDATDDSTVLWPEDRPRISVGRLEIREKILQPNDRVIFDPTVLPDGIECSNDPVLHARQAIYAASSLRRFNGL